VDPHTCAWCRPAARGAAGCCGATQPGSGAPLHHLLGSAAVQRPHAHWLQAPQAAAAGGGTAAGAVLGDAAAAAAAAALVDDAAAAAAAAVAAVAAGVAAVASVPGLIQGDQKKGATQARRCVVPLTSGSGAAGGPVRQTRGWLVARMLAVTLLAHVLQLLLPVSSRRWSHAQWEMVTRRE